MILDPAHDWERVSQGHRFTEGPAVDRQGNVSFSEIPNNRIHKISTDGKVSVFKEDTGGANGLMFGPDGRLYACQNGRKRGEIYFSDPGGNKVWFIDRSGSKRAVVQEGITFPNGVRLSPDHALLDVADYATKWIWSFRVQPDGSLANGQAFHRLETIDDDTSAGPDGMTLDSEGHLYVATRLGVQICDQAGRVVGIINKPQPGRSRT
jgi:gluconolactonase